MSIQYNLPDGSEINLLLSNTAGMIDAICRANTRSVWDAAALAAGLTYEVTQDIIDAETGEITKQPTGEVKVARGVYIDHIGPVQISSAILDEQGLVITAARIDSRHHVNFRMTNPAISVIGTSGLPKYIETAIAWSTHGVPDANINTSEFALEMNGVSLIDPSSIATPSRLWL